MEFCQSGKVGTLNQAKIYSRLHNYSETQSEILKVS